MLTNIFQRGWFNHQALNILRKDECRIPPFFSLFWGDFDSLDLFGLLEGENGYATRHHAILISLVFFNNPLILQYC